MSHKTDEFRIDPEHVAACEVYAVAIGDRLGLDIEALRRLRSCVNNSVSSGSEDLDPILVFVADLARAKTLGDYPVPEELAKSASRVARAYCEVARLVQPLSVRE